MKTPNILVISTSILVVILFSAYLLFFRSPEKIAEILLSEPGIGTVSTTGTRKGVLLYFEPSNISPGFNGKFSIALKIDTTEKVVEGAEIVINYDNNLVELKNQTAASIFPDLKFTQGSGQITLTGSGSVLGQGTIANFDFYSRQTGETLIEIETNSKILEKGTSKNILTSTTPALITIKP